MKHIQTMKTALEGLNAVATAAAAQMQENMRRFLPEALEDVNAPLRTGVQEAYEAAVRTIADAHTAALTAVEAWSEISPEKLDAQTIDLLKSEIPMTAADFRRLILRFEDNFAMLSAIEAEAEKRGLLFQCGYIPHPEDRSAVYGKFFSSALSMADTILLHNGVSDNLIAGFADPSHVTDPRFIAVLQGLSATQTGQTDADTTPASDEKFGFNFRKAAPTPTRW